VIAPGDVQRMSAGRGVRHSEFNASKTDGVHFLQIWIEPDATGVEPSYEQTHIGDDEKRGRLRLIASPDGADGSVKIHQDARVYAMLLDHAESVAYMLAPGRRAYVHVVRGGVGVNGTRLAAGDAAKIEKESSILIDQATDAEVLLFDLP
jgi:redox-sensitive bicupin YhaK (pirin superfamily)